MSSLTRLYCEDSDIAVVLIPDSPVAVRAVDSQPKENLAVRYHGENHQILEILGHTDSSLEDLSAAGDIGQVIVLRRSKAYYTFGSVVNCNVRLELPGVSPEQLEMTLPYRQIGVEDTQDQSYQPSKKLRDVKLTARRRRRRHDRSDYKKPNYTEVSGPSCRLR